MTHSRGREYRGTSINHVDEACDVAVAAGTGVPPLQEKAPP